MSNQWQAFIVASDQRCPELQQMAWVGGHHQPALRLDLLVGACDVELLPLEPGPSPLGALLQEHQRLAMMTYTLTPKPQKPSV